ncbi:MAG: hypothetical protein R3C44_14150 [Chloroflexota bacterium]
MTLGIALVGWLALILAELGWYSRTLAIGWIIARSAGARNGCHARAARFHPEPVDVVSGAATPLFSYVADLGRRAWSCGWSRRYGFSFGRMRW